MTTGQFAFYLSVATLIQIFLLVFIKRQGVGTWFIYLLISIICTQNAMYLVITLLPNTNTILIEILGRFFHAISFISYACFLSHAIEVCDVQQKSYTHKIETLVWMTALCGAILSIVSDEIIMGFRQISFTITAIQGDNFWVRLTLAILSMLTATVVLINEWRNLPDGNKKKHCLLLLYSYTFLAAFTLVVIMAMKYGFETSFAITFPFVTTLSLTLIVYGGFKHGWTTVTITNSEDLKMSEQDQLNDIFVKYKEGVYSFNKATEEVDLLLLMHAYNKHNGNMMKTASAIGLGRSTLYKKVQKHGLK